MSCKPRRDVLAKRGGLPYDLSVMMLRELARTKLASSRTPALDSFAEDNAKFPDLYSLRLLVM